MGVIAGDDEPYRGNRLFDKRRRAKEHRQQPYNLLLAATGQKRNDTPRLRFFQPGNHVLINPNFADLVKQRMPGIDGRYARFIVKGFFKGINNNHLVHQLFHLFRAPRAVRPYLRADVIDNGYPQFFCCPGKVEVKTAIVDQDNDARPLPPEKTDTISFYLPKGRYLRQGVEPHEGFFGHIVKAMQPSLPHVFFAQAVKYHVGVPFKQATHEVCAMYVARRLAGADEYLFIGFSHGASSRDKKWN